MSPRYDLLEALCCHLDTVKPEDFNFASYYSENWKGGKPGCGTTACAFGYAPFVPEIAAAGLWVVSNNRGNWFLVDLTLYSDPILAASEIFGLSLAEANYLFSPYATHSGLDDAPSGNATPAQIAEHIRKFCAWRCAHP
jgi:hypothetical protein